MAELKSHESVSEDFFTKDLVVKEGKRNFKLWANLMLALKYAMYVDKKLEVEVLDTFVQKKILDFRLFGIDNHKELTKRLDTLQDRVGKENVYIYINTSKMINEKTKGVFKKGWDEREDNAEYQQKRNEIQKELMMLIDKGYVKTWEDVKEYFNK